MNNAQPLIWCVGVDYQCDQGFIGCWIGLVGHWDYGKQQVKNFMWPLTPSLSLSWGHSVLCPCWFFCWILRYCHCLNSLIQWILDQASSMKLEFANVFFLCYVNNSCVRASCATRLIREARSQYLWSFFSFFRIVPIFLTFDLIFVLFLL